LRQVKYKPSRTLACYNKEFFMKSKQSGFTLVEIAIVLVIVGLLLGGVLKGQELITSGKAKALYADKSAVQAAYNTYNDRFRAIPGDDIAASTRFSGLACGVVGANASATATTCINGGGDGQINPIGNTGNANNYARVTSTLAVNFVNGNTNEQYKLWQHLRAAQLIKTEGTGAGEISINPANAANGWTSVSSVPTWVGQQTSVLYFVQTGVPGNIAAALDGANDDGFTNTGGIRSISNGNAGAPNTVPSAGYATGTTYAVSTNLL